MTQPDTQPKQANPNKIREDFYRLAVDWVLLRAEMPKPENRIRRSKVIEYGHLAEWASDKAACITEVLSSWHALVADHRRETPPQTGVAEQVRIVKAWKYLEPRIEQLVTLVAADDLNELSEIHLEIKRILKLDDAHANWLPIECGRCDHKTVFSGVGENYGRIRCYSCGLNEDETLKDFHIHRTLGQVIERLDTPEPAVP
ncbi:MAG: hypothetical protein E6Q97_25270 [Desulfurellales bacterium]|nr:MAG: hypothetical protein E6Q97_25270 [Desulfurellales bacterium]